MAINIKDLISAQQKLAKTDSKQERMSIAEFKKLVGVQEQSSIQQDQISAEKIVVEKDEGSYTRLDAIKAILDKTFKQSNVQTSFLEKLSSSDKEKLSMEQSIESERDRAEQLKTLKAIEGKLGDKGEKESKSKDYGGISLGGLSTAMAVALGSIVGAISGYATAIVKMNKLLFSAIESAIVGLGKFFPSLKKILFNIETTFVLGMEMIKGAFATFIKKAVTVFDGVKDFIGGVLSKVMNSDVMKTIVGTFERVVSGVKSFFAPVVDAFKVLEEVSSPISKAIGVLKDKIGIVLEFFSTIGTRFTMLTKIFGAVKSIAKTLALPLTIIMSIWDTLKGAFEGWEKGGFIGAISGAVSGLINSIIGAPLDLLKGIVSWVLGAFGFDKAEKFLDSFSFEDIIKDFFDAFFAPLQLLQDLIMHPIDTVKSMFNKISTLLDSINLSGIMKDLIDAVMLPIDILKNVFTTVTGLLDTYVIQPLTKVLEPITSFFKNIKEQLFGFIEDFGIPEISFTIPIINKKVAIGPFYPFRPETGTERVSTNTAVDQKSSVIDGKESSSSTLNQNIVTSGKSAYQNKDGSVRYGKDETNVLSQSEKVVDGKAAYTTNMATFSADTGKATISGDVGEREISKRAFNKIKSNAKSGGDADNVAEIVKEDDAYQKLGFFDKRKVDVGYAKATDLLALQKPEALGANTVTGKSAENAGAAAAPAASAPIIVNAPSTVNQSSNQNVSMPAPIRNTDTGLSGYIRKNSSFV